MVNREIKDLMLRAVEKLAEKKYFQSVGMTLYRNEDTGEWTTEKGNYPITYLHIPSIKELINFTKNN
jgi:hypothetical protein